VFTPDQGACATDGSLSLTVNPLVTPTFNNIGPFCQGSQPSNLPLVSNNGISGSWNPPVVSTNFAGMATYIFTPTSASQCESSTNLNIVINASPLTLVSQNGMQLTSLTNNASYQWIDCATNTPVSGATSQTFTPSVVTGSFAVIVASNNCSDTSECITVDQSSIEENESVNVRVQPNPFGGDLTVTWYEISVDAVRLFDAAGKLIFEVKNPIEKSLVIPTSHLMNGVYFLQVNNPKGTATEKVIKY
jgi:hypothetical protein